MRVTFLGVARGSNIQHSSTPIPHHRSSSSWSPSQPSSNACHSVQSGTQQIIITSSHILSKACHSLFGVACGSHMRHSQKPLIDLTWSWSKTRTVAAAASSGCEVPAEGGCVQGRICGRGERTRCSRADSECRPARRSRRPGRRSHAQPLP